jgi:hypothetical protein
MPTSPTQFPSPPSGNAPIVSDYIGYGSYSGADIKVVVHMPFPERKVKELQDKIAMLKKEMEEEEKRNPDAIRDDFVVGPDGEYKALKEEKADAVADAEAEAKAVEAVQEAQETANNAKRFEFKNDKEKDKYDASLVKKYETYSQNFDTANNTITANNVAKQQIQEDLDALPPSDVAGRQRLNKMINDLNNQNSALETDLQKAQTGMNETTLEQEKMTAYNDVIRPKEIEKNDSIKKEAKYKKIGDKARKDKEKQNKVLEQAEKELLIAYKMPEGPKKEKAIANAQGKIDRAEELIDSYDTVISDADTKVSEEKSYQDLLTTQIDNEYSNPNGAFAKTGLTPQTSPGSVANTDLLNVENGVKKEVDQKVKDKLDWLTSSSDNLSDVVDNAISQSSTTPETGDELERVSNLVFDNNEKIEDYEEQIIQCDKTIAELGNKDPEDLTPQEQIDLNAARSTKFIATGNKNALQKKTTELERQEAELYKRANDANEALTLASSNPSEGKLLQQEALIGMGQELMSLEAELQKLESIPVTKVLGEVQTISWSIFREKSPVRPLGSVYPRGFTRGPRTIAGTMVFTMFYKHVLHEFLEANLAVYSSGTSDYDLQQNTATLPDQLPPLNLGFVFANEYGAISYMGIYGVEFVQDGGTFSIEDILSENVVQYVARDIDPMSHVQNAMRNKSGPTNAWTADASSLLQDKFNTIERRDAFK